MTEHTYNVIKPENGVPIKAWTKGVPLEDAARQQPRIILSQPSVLCFAFLPARVEFRIRCGGCWPAVAR
jgi:hypothetical protein